MKALREYDFKVGRMLITLANYTFTTEGDHYD